MFKITYLTLTETFFRFRREIKLNFEPVVFNIINNFKLEQNYFHYHRNCCNKVCCSSLHKDVTAHSMQNMFDPHFSKKEISLFFHCHESFCCEKESSASERLNKSQVAVFFR